MLSSDSSAVAASQDCHTSPEPFERPAHIHSQVLFKLSWWGTYLRAESAASVLDIPRHEIKADDVKEVFDSLDGGSLLGRRDKVFSRALTSLRRVPDPRRTRPQQLLANSSG
mmetsp:Transcript_24795/g.59652  ORF Transcript_24795/g.59652 Transcript_24795/m.59652 type:complete len:112 (+) Transcript_24795:1228-1563(+)